MDFYCIFKFVLQILDIVVIVIFFVALIIILPIFVKIDSVFSLKFNKIFFLINICGVRILCGYVQIAKYGIVCHLSEKKAVIFKFQSILGVRKKFSIFTTQLPFE